MTGYNKPAEDSCARQLRAMAGARGDPACAEIRSVAAAWGAPEAILPERLPQQLDDRDQFAYRLVVPALNEIFGQREQRWGTCKPTDCNSAWVRAVPTAAALAVAAQSDRRWA